MSFAARILASILGEQAAIRSPRREPQLPQHLFMIPERGPAPQPVPIKAQR